MLINIKSFLHTLLTELMVLMVSTGGRRLSMVMQINLEIENQSKSDAYY